MLEGKWAIEESKASGYIVYISMIYLGDDWVLRMRNILRVFMGIHKEKLEWMETLMEIREIKCRLQQGKGKIIIIES